ncbi:MAG: FKBP-type peptidyl-prolyl cis-trans isomerase [Rhizomicrobium sp.]
MRGATAWLGLLALALTLVVAPASAAVPPSLSAAANTAFLKSFAAQKGVYVTNSGVEIKVLHNGFGKRPKATDRVIVNYTGKLINGEVFDETEPGLPATFTVDELIPGWTEALQRMREGDHWEIVIPAHLAYGVRGAGSAVPPNQTLVFDLTLLKVLPPEQHSGGQSGGQ